MAATLARTPDNQPTPVPDLIAQIRGEGGLVPWLSSRVSAERLREYDAALERRAALAGLAASPRGPLRPVR